jgi:hypothetical protein
MRSAKFARDCSESSTLGEDQVGRLDLQLKIFNTVTFRALLEDAVGKMCTAM